VPENVKKSLYMTSSEEDIRTNEETKRWGARDEDTSRYGKSRPKERDFREVVLSIRWVVLKSALPINDLKII